MKKEKNEVLVLPRVAPHLILQGIQRSTTVKMRSQDAWIKWFMGAAVAAMAVLPTAANPAVPSAPYPKDVPDLMTTFTGEKVTRREQWEYERAPELLAEFTREVYGRRPVERPKTLSFA
ncbi:MAG: hypothetical protein J6T19_01040, partial [Paludibacteraceae bacterium]|nr:hypothetical protein [Paludibacteraceae bacterium]